MPATPRVPMVTNQAIITGTDSRTGKKEAS
jgi:hypothetical protein